MELTDGHKIVVAMEFKPIPCLNTKLTPGCKILLMGPMRCFNKLIFLEEKNVKILGGEVNKYEIENAYENVLLRKLGKPINQNPKSEYYEPVVVVPPERILPPLASSVHVKTNDDLFDDDDLLLDIDIDDVVASGAPSNRSCDAAVLQLDEQFVTRAVQARCSSPPKSVVASKKNVPRTSLISSTVVSSTVDNYDPMLSDTDGFDNIDEEEERIIYNENLQRHHYQYEEPPEAVSTTLTASPKESKDTPKQIIVPITKLILDKNYPYKIRGCHVVTTTQLGSIANSEERFDISFIVKCEIDSLCEKISLKNNSWTILVYLRDSSPDLLQVSISTFNKGLI